MPSNTEIINNLKKDTIDIEVHIRKTYDYHKKELEFKYLTKGSLLEKEFKENNSQRKNQFYYTAGEKEIDELAKKDPMELFDFLAPKHLEKEKGFGETIGKEPKKFKSPCRFCNQISLTTLGWSEEGYPNELEIFYCRLCRTCFGWFEIPDDPVEVQLEMKGHYKVFKEKEIEKDLKRLEEIEKEAVMIRNRVAESRKKVKEEQK